jgi:galactose-1-phosphate uridylyltransferase
MEIYPTIEALLHYANAHLLLDELDYVYCRNMILDLLNLTSYEEYEVNDDEIDSMANPSEILTSLTNYAIAQKLTDEEGREMLARRLMDCVMKRPGEIADLFSRLSPTKAFDFLADYGVKSGEIKQGLKKWEAKSTKGKIEVGFSGIDACVKSDKKGYPQCCKCRDGEGFGSKLNIRSVPIELYGERMFFSFDSRPVKDLLSHIVSEYHRPLTVDKTALAKMFDFAVMMPGWTIAAADSVHENYTVSARPLPMSKAPEVAKFKSPEYPYIAITTVDWYIGTIRLNSSNREKLTEYADRLIEIWRDMTGGNTVATAVRKVDPSNFTVEILFYNNNQVSDPDYSSLSKADTAAELMGLFCIDKKTEDALTMSEKFLTKQEKFTPAKLDGDLKPQADLINRLLANASPKITELEASLDVKDEINRTLENALQSRKVTIDALYKQF